MIALAQAYVNLKPFYVDASNFDRLYEASREAAIAKAREVYGPDYFVDVRTEEGSWRVWTTILLVGNGLLGTLDLVSKYPDIKHGIKELCSDAKEYAADVCGSILVKSGASHDQRFAVQRRLMAPGKVYKLLKELDSLEADLPTLSRGQASERVSAIEERIRRLTIELSAADMETIRKLVQNRGLPISPDAFEISAPIVAKFEDPGIAEPKGIYNRIEHRLSSTMLSSSEIEEKHPRRFVCRWVSGGRSEGCS